MIDYQAFERRRLRRISFGIKHQEVYAEGILFYKLLPLFWTEVGVLMEMNGGSSTTHLDTALTNLMSRTRYIPERKRLVIEEAFDHYVFLLQACGPKVAGCFLVDMMESL
ncbi:MULTISPECIES: hypothetical protein [Paenibacillus]|uniref:hypothetical protein n=1 Tax=Paenibacillus TaxID=44249 RepID=UPI0022B870E8|nr:hypothetical protein [Paenibacillus caseinilyticus]MCZ8520149.1 hypothetical protein [Paenibacillus caseinilyticus]